MRDLILSSGSLFPMRHEGEEDILKILSKPLADRRDIVYRLKRQGKIKVEGKGVYLKA